MSLGENIYKLRTEKRMSQEDFASAMEVSRQSVSKWENDMAVPELEKLIKMAKLFEVSLDELVGNTPPQQTADPLPVTAPETKPVMSFGTKEAFSIALLISAAVIPLFLYLLPSWTAMLDALCFIPPVATAISAFLVPNNKFLFHTYQVFLLILTLLLPLLIAEGVWFVLLNWGGFWFWFNRQE